MNVCNNLGESKSMKTLDTKYIISLMCSSRKLRLLYIYGNYISDCQGIIKEPRQVMRKSDILLSPF